ncbi:MAG: ADP-ribosylglycohydrolase family protein [Pleurocapsa sp.]
MNSSTFDQFQGIWLGSIIGQALASQKSCGEQTKIINFPAQTWLDERQKVAQILLNTENLPAKDLGQRLLRRKTTEPALTVGQNYSLREIISQNRVKTIKTVEHGSILLSLLSLMIFYGNDLNLFSKIIGEYNLKSANSRENAEMRTGILIWSCLLTRVLNNKFQPEINVKPIIRRTIDIVKVSETLLTKMLEIAIEAAQSGISLHQLVEELSSGGSDWQKAIALSWYCFTTTPHDFRLSIQRAASLEPNIAWLTAALTGTVSGAYNGIAVIPWRWRAIANQNSIYRLESQTARQLFESWLGIYSLNSHPLFDHQLGAVASPQIIQPRKALKIISQTSFGD